MKPKVIGIGLNKTATKSLAQCLEAMGYNNQTYSLRAFSQYQQQDWPSLFSLMDQFDSFEDWPWPLMYKEIDQQYPDAKFILTTRSTADVWYRSLCKMAVRMGPLKDFEQAIYGYAMPQGHRDEHLAFYETHNRDVREYFASRPGKLLEICFDHTVSMKSLCDFLDQPFIDFIPPHANKSAPVYGGDSIYRAQFSRVIFQTRWHALQWLRNCKHKFLTVRR